MSDSAAKKDGSQKKKPLPLMLGSKSHGKEKQGAPEVGIEMPLDEFLVNLNGGGDHYLKVSLSLGLKKGLTEEEAKKRIAPMRDAILTVLSSKSLKDLSETKNRDTLKEELKVKINEAAPEEPVVKVYFTAFATQ
jgi:flagellar FliL protein